VLSGMKSVKLEIVMATLNVLSICGSLRRGSFNAMVQRLLPSLAPDGMINQPRPSFADFPLYNADIQNSTGLTVGQHACRCHPGSRRRDFLHARV
jgi:hypothetical protein